MQIRSKMILLALGKLHKCTKRTNKLILQTIRYYKYTSREEKRGKEIQCWDVPMKVDDGWKCAMYCTRDMERDMERDVERIVTAATEDI